jgi:hypothetical protein
MNAKEIIEKLRLTFAELTGNPEPQPTSLNVATLQDGTEVEVTELAVGGIVTITGTPAPAGEHTLSDGSIIVLGENGVIMEIKPPAAVEPVDAPVADDMNARFSAFESATNEKFAAYESKFAAYEAKLAKANQVIEGLLNLTQTLAETPTGTPDASVKTTNSFQDEPKKKSLDILFS